MTEPRRQHPLATPRSRSPRLVVAVVAAVAAVVVVAVVVVIMRGGGSDTARPAPTAATTLPATTVEAATSTSAPSATAIGPTTTAPLGTAGVPFQPGAEANRELWEREFPLPQPTGRRVTVGTVAEVNAAMPTLAPGDELVLRDGTYDGEVVVSAKGRPGAPITVRAENRWKAVVVGEGSWILNGEHVVVRDLLFDGGRGGTAGVVVVKGKNLRVSGNRFDAVGYAADDTDTRSVIRMETETDSYNLVDANVVDRPNTVFTYISQGTGYSVYSHNVITGPNGMGGRYNSYLIKSGSVLDPRPSNTVFQYNTVNNWGPAVPEAIDEKTVGATYRSNKMPDVVLYLRHGNSSRVIGNELAELHIDGSDHRIEGNLIRSDVPWSKQSAPLLTLSTEDRSTAIHEPAQRNRITGNVVVYAGKPGDSPFQERNLGVWGPPEAIDTVRDNVVQGNTFVRVAPRAGAADGIGFIGFIEQADKQATLLANNTFADNRFACAGCGTAASKLAGASGNRMDATVTLAALPTPAGPKVTEKPAIRSFGAVADGNGTVTLTWDAPDAWYVLIDQGVGLGARGSGQRAASTSATTFTLRAVGPAGFAAITTTAVPR